MSKIVALLGNPNVGKSTVFNELTGLKQHTGNWPGKTVDVAMGEFTYDSETVKVVDLPGAYSLLAHSPEEEVTRDYIAQESPDVIVVVCNGTCLERNMNLLLQSIEISRNVILCVNMIDEAKQKGIEIDKEKLEKMLGIPVVFTSAKNGVGIEEIKKAICDFSVKDKIYEITYPIDIEKKAIELQKILINKSQINPKWLSLRFLEGDVSIINKIKLSGSETELINNILADIDKLKISEEIMSVILIAAKNICNHCVKFTKLDYNIKDKKLDRVLTGKYFAVPIMILLLLMVFWITIFGANYPSQLLSVGFEKCQTILLNLFDALRIPPIIKGIFVEGIFGVLGWVVSVMLPPMAIFFPLFSLLEDSGYLPRIAFNMDKSFKKCSSCGKQSLTMCLGLGCNAVGVMGCRIIDSKRERLIAILTNNFIPCNGRFPSIIAIILMFAVSFNKGLLSGTLAAGILMGLILFGIFMTFLCSYILSKTVLKGMPSSFVLEMPSYRRPQFLRVIIRSTIDKTLKVLCRAIVVAAPAGAVIWLLANINVSGISILNHVTMFLDPFARWFGMDGVIITAFILGMPANEIVLPIALMAYVKVGTMVPLTNLFAIKEILVSNGWTLTTAICTVLFFIMHWPCATTLLTIKKETNSKKWTLLSAFIPTACGLLICFVINLVSKFF